MARGTGGRVRPALHSEAARRLEGGEGSPGLCRPLADHCAKALPQHVICHQMPRLRAHTAGMDDYAGAAHIAVDLLAGYVADSRAGIGPATAQPDPDVLAERLELARWIREGGMDAGAFSDWLP